MCVGKQTIHLIVPLHEFPAWRGKQNKAVTELCNENRDKYAIQKLAHSLSAHGYMLLHFSL